MRRPILLFAASIFAAPLAFAQNPAPSVPPNPPPSGGIPAPAGAGSGISSQAGAVGPALPDASSQDMLTQCRNYRERIQQSTLHIQKLMEQAKLQQDVVRMNCLMDKYQQIRIDLASADRSISAMYMEEAVGGRDKAAIAHEFSTLTILHQKALVLVGAAEACIGGESNSVLKVEVDSSIPTEDHAGTPVPEGPSLERPTAASPYK